MKTSASKKLARFYQQFSGNDRVLVIINADPDAIASAMAVKRLLWRKVSGVTLSHINVIKRPDNIAMIRLLGVKLIHTEDIDESEFDRFVLVDSQPDHSERFARFRPDVIIDHHPRTESADAPVTDIRPEYGATATILTQYLRAAKIKPSAKLATGLLHAIKTDTKNFEREASLEDINAFHFLFRYANVHLARKIEQADLRLDFLRYFQIALSSFQMRRNKVFVHLGPVVNPDVCVLVADFFMRICSVQWSIVSGVYEERAIIIFRNDGLRKDAGKLAKKGFSDVGSAGGHKSMARAEISLPALEDTNVDHGDTKELLRWIIGRVEMKKSKNINFKKEILGLKS